VKRCSRCGETKTDGDFYKDRSHVSGLSTSCKGCLKGQYREYRREYYRRYRLEHLDALKEKERDRRVSRAVVPVLLERVCKGCGVVFTTKIVAQVYCTQSCGRKDREKKGHVPAQYNKVCPRCDVDFIARRSDKIFCSKICKQLNSARLNAPQKRKIPKNRIARRMSKEIHKIVKGGGGTSWRKLVGYNEDALKLHLERCFLPGMDWSNYGTSWHIDHKIPIRVFNIQSYGDIDFKKCWSLENLQPLWAIDNMRKGGKLAHPFQPSLSIRQGV
jgi:hypothetical protein